VKEVVYLHHLLLFFAAWNLWGKIAFLFGKFTLVKPTVPNKLINLKT